MGDQPANYDIGTLLNHGVQPFKDLDEDTLTALGKGIGRGTMAVPVALTEDGVLVDGHQRLKAMLTEGRKRINASDVRVVKGATAKNALEWAVRLNVQRRHLTVEEKAETARQLQRERHWSQGKIAELFGVSRPAVSQWLARFPDDEDDGPVYVEGKDEKLYTPEPKPARVPKPPKVAPDPWDPDGGYLFKDVVKLAHRAKSIEVPADRLTPEEIDRVRTIIGDAIVVLESRLAELTD